MSRRTDKDAVSAATRSRWRFGREFTAGRFLLGYPAAAVVLAAFWAVMAGSIADKCTTCDELVHQLSGVAAWKFGDYRLNPENGVLPSRLAGLPAATDDYKFPNRQHRAWRESQAPYVCEFFYYKLGNDTSRLLLDGRMAVALLAVVTALLVYAWSRRLFGPVGGMLSLLCCVLTPAVLANGPLMTSDMAGACFFLLSLWCLERMLRQMTLLIVLATGLAMGGLFVSKMSAPLIVPIAVILLLLRLFKREPMDMKLPRREMRHVNGRWARAAALAGATVAIAAVVFVTIWAFYGFSFPMMPNATAADQPAFSWDFLLNREGLVPAALRFFREHRLLPEAFIYGYGHVFALSRSRRAFFNGECGIYGWKSFFPYAFLVKTPLPFFALLGLAAWATVRRWRKPVAQLAPKGETVPAALAIATATTPSKTAPSLWRNAAASFTATAPLWLLMAAIWAIVIPSHLDIGQRHILPIYPALCILCGAAATWFSSRTKPLAYVTAGLLVLLLAEMAFTYPNYLAYFNQLIGGPKNGYKHLVDSSLDWGQDLPALKKYLDGHAKPGERVYLCYFGNGNPDYYGIRAIKMPGSPSMDWREQAEKGRFMPQPSGGLYCISATAYQSAVLDLPGRWNTEYEALYHKIQSEMAPFNATENDPNARQALLAGMGNYWFEVRRRWDYLRTARLMAYLRTLQPADTVNYSILIFRISDEQARQALEGPPAELYEGVQNGERFDTLLPDVARE